MKVLRDDAYIAELNKPDPEEERSSVFHTPDLVKGGAWHTLEVRDSKGRYRKLSKPVDFQKLHDAMDRTIQSQLEDAFLSLSTSELCQLQAGRIVFLPNRLI